MTISVTTNAITYAGNSITTVFPIPFYFLLNSDLVVKETTGSTTVDLGINTDYTVSGAGVLTGGTLTRTTATATGTTLKIVRTEPITQLTDYIQDDPFPAESHEKALDKLTMICQQLQTNIDNAVLAASTNGEVNTASNLGGGLGLYKQKVALDLQFRSISSISNGTVGMSIVSDRIEIDVTYLLGLANSWTGGQQSLEYNIPTAATSSDHIGWSSLIHNNAGTVNKDNMVALRGHAYHDGNFDNDVGAAWGITTEVWTNQSGQTTMVGGEFACISQKPTQTYPVVGFNTVFKNRLDTATHPVASVGSGSYYNYNSTGILITAQARPSGAGAAWSNVGSGWNSAIRIGDPGFGSGLDWEGGNSGTTGSPSTVKNYSTILDMTNMNDVVHGSGKDQGGGYPWLFLWRTGSTYFGARFVSTITTGAIELIPAAPVAGGAGYAVNDVGNITGGGGTGGTYKVLAVSAGVVTNVQLTAAGTGYHVVSPVATTATSGAGTGLTINIEQIVGERLEFWRMTDPGDLSTGNRYGFVDFAYNPLNDRGGAFLRSFP